LRTGRPAKGSRELDTFDADPLSRILDCRPHRDACRHRGHGPISTADHRFRRISGLLILPKTYQDDRQHCRRPRQGVTPRGDHDEEIPSLGDWTARGHRVGRCPFSGYHRPTTLPPECRKSANRVIVYFRKAVTQRFQRRTRRNFRSHFNA
jgi:hypothetical protein